MCELNLQMASRSWVGGVESGDVDDDGDRLANLGKIEWSDVAASRSDSLR